MLQPIQLPVSQYSKLVRYKNTLGCSSEAELIGILTQTFLCTLAQPLSISSKEVDMLLTQGQGEPKIRNIMMALLVQFLSAHTVKDDPTSIQKVNKELTSLFKPIKITPFKHTESLLKPKSEAMSVDESLSSCLVSPVSSDSNAEPDYQNLGVHQGETFSKHSFQTPFLNTPIQTQNQPTPPRFTPPIIKIPTSSPTNKPPSPVSLPFTSPRSLSTNLLKSQQRSDHSRPCTPEQNTAISEPDEGNMVQGPVINSDDSIIKSEDDSTSISKNYTEQLNSTNSSPTSSISDSLNSVNLLEVLKALKSGTGDSHDDVVNKLVSVINELVENTEFTMNDIMDMLKSSLEPSAISKIPTPITTLNNQTPLFSTTTTHSSNTTTFEQRLNSLDQKGLSMTLPNTPNLTQTGILLPPNWVPVSFNQLRRPNFNGVRRVAPYNSTPIRPSPLDIKQNPDKKCNTCNTCNTSFSQFSSLLRHIRQVHQKIKDKPCPLCGERFARSQYLPNHIWRTHYNRAVSNVKCFFCPEILDTKEGIQQHLWLNHVKARR